MPEVPANAIIADEAIAPVPEVAAAEPEDWDAEIAAAPAVLPAELGDDELNHEQVVNHLLRIPYMQELALFRCMMPILEETRKKLQKTEKSSARGCVTNYTRTHRHWKPAPPYTTSELRPNTARTPLWETISPPTYATG